MTASVLQPAQFGSTLPSAHSGVSEPRYTEDAHPLALMSSTNGSAAAAATWRKPGRVLPYSKATMGSTFQPF